MQTAGAQAERLDRIAGVEHDEAGALADGEAIVVEAHDARR